MNLVSDTEYFLKCCLPFNLIQVLNYASNDTYMGHVMRIPVFAICEQQRRRSAWASAQSDQHLFYSLPGYYYTSFFYIWNFKPLVVPCGCAGRFESYLVANPEDRFSGEEAHIYQYFLSYWKNVKKMIWAVARQNLQNDVIRVCCTLGGCPGWSESSLGVQVILLVLSCCGSFRKYMYVTLH